MDSRNRFIKRIESLISEYQNRIIPKRKCGDWNDYYDQEDYDIIQEWLVKVENILCIIFTENSIQFKRFINTRENKKTKLADKLHTIKGLLKACLDDLSEGFIQSQEFIIANEFFDSLLEEAEFYLSKKNKDLSAILLRIVLEDSLKRIAKKEGISILNKKGKRRKASDLNRELKEKNYYNQTIWRQIQVWLDIGNDAHHGNFGKYEIEQVDDFRNGLKNWLKKIPNIKT